MPPPLPTHEPDYSIRHTQDCAACWSRAMRRVPMTDPLISLEIVRSYRVDIVRVPRSYGERYARAAERRGAVLTRV